MEASKSHHTIATVAQKMLLGQTSIIEGSRQLVGLAAALDDDDIYDNDRFLIFRGIDSESDTLPTGQSRQYWNKEVLKKKDGEIADYEAIIRDDALKACRWLLDTVKTAE
jgi:hypothetical protein